MIWPSGWLPPKPAASSMDCSPSGVGDDGTVDAATAAALSSSAGVIRDAMIRELSNELNDHRADLIQYLGFSTDVSVEDNLRAWCANPGSTVFVLHSVLTSLGRTDLATKLINKMQSMPLFVVVMEDDPRVNSNPSKNPQGLRFQTVMTSCDAELSSALRVALGGDLSNYQITGPGSWVSWSTKAFQLKGQQLTLQRRQNTSWKTEQSPYGLNNCRPDSTKGYTHKSKIDPPEVCEMKYLPVPGNFQQRQAWDFDETLVKRPNTLPSSLNITSDHEMTAMIEIQKPAYGLSPSPTPISSDNNNMDALNTSLWPVPADTDDSLVGQCPSYPAVSPTITSVEDEFTVDENTGVKMPKYGSGQKNIQNAQCSSSNHLPFSTTHGPRLFPQPVSPIDNSVVNNITNPSAIQLSSNSSLNSAAGGRNLNNLNSSSQTKPKQIPSSVELYDSFKEDIIHTDDLFQNNSYGNAKLGTHCDKIKSDNVEETIEVDSAVPSSFASVNCQGQTLSGDGCRNPDRNPVALRGSDGGGHWSSGHVPAYVVSGNQLNSSVANTNCSSQRSSQISYANSVTDNSQADNIDCGDIVKMQGQANWKVSGQMVSRSNYSQFHEGQNKTFSVTRTTAHRIEQPNNLSQNNSKFSPLLAQQEDRQAMTDQLQYQNTHSKPNAAFLVHSPATSDDFLQDYSPPPYLEVLDGMETGTDNLSVAENSGIHSAYQNRTNVYPAEKDKKDQGENWKLQQNSNSGAKVVHGGISPPEIIRTKCLPAVNTGHPSAGPHQGPIHTGTTGWRLNDLAASGETDVYLTACDPPQPPQMANNFPRVGSVSLPQPPPQRQQPHQQQQPHHQPPQASGSVVSADGTSYNYIDHGRVTSASLSQTMAPLLPPPRRSSQPFRMSLDEQLARVQGWCPDETDETIERTMEDYRCQDGCFIVWKSQERNRFVITVSHHRVLNHFLVEEEREANSDNTIYFIYKYGGFRSENFLDVVNHYIQSGIKQPLVDERFGNKAYAVIHIPLKYPLKVKVVFKRKSHAK